MINDDPINLRIFGLRSFGESLYHSITDDAVKPEVAGPMNANGTI